MYLSQGSVAVSTIELEVTGVQVIQATNVHKPTNATSGFSALHSDCVSVMNDEFCFVLPSF